MAQSRQVLVLPFLALGLAAMGCSNSQTTSERKSVISVGKVQRAFAKRGMPLVRVGDFEAQPWIHVRWSLTGELPSRRGLFMVDIYRRSRVAARDVGRMGRTHSEKWPLIRRRNVVVTLLRNARARDQRAIAAVVQELG
jgi:hypothetical protein